MEGGKQQIVFIHSKISNENTDTPYYFFYMKILNDYKK